MSHRFALIVALVGALIVPGTASAATSTAHVQDDHFASGSPSIHLGDSVQWQWDSTKHFHSVTADKFSLFDSGIQMGSPLFGPIPFDRAGGFAYHCQVHGNMRGTVNVQMATTNASPAVGQMVTITFASSAAPSGFSEQIQKRKAGGTWKNFSVGNTGTSVSFTPPRARTFQFRARLVNGSVMSNWSPILSLTAH